LDSSIESTDKNISKIKGFVFDVCADVDHVRNDDQSQQNLPDDSASIAASKAIQSEDDSKVLFDTPVSRNSSVLSFITCW